MEFRLQAAKLGNRLKAELRTQQNRFRACAPSNT